MSPRNKDLEILRNPRSNLPRSSNASSTLSEQSPVFAGHPRRDPSHREIAYIAIITLVCPLYREPMDPGLTYWPPGENPMGNKNEAHHKRWVFRPFLGRVRWNYRKVLPPVPFSVMKSHSVTIIYHEKPNHQQTSIVISYRTLLKLLRSCFVGWD